MHNKTHVWFIDAHSERDRGSDDAHVVAQKRILMFCAFRRRQPRVIRLRAYLVLVQLSRERVSALAACTINDAIVVRPTSNERQKLFISRRFWNYAVRQ